MLPSKLLKEMRHWDLTPNVATDNAAISAGETGAESLPPLELRPEKCQGELSPEVT